MWGLDIAWGLFSCFSIIVCIICYCDERQWKPWSFLNADECKNKWCKYSESKLFYCVPQVLPSCCKNNYEKKNQCDVLSFFCCCLFCGSELFPHLYTLVTTPFPFPIMNLESAIDTSHMIISIWTCSTSLWVLFILYWHSCLFRSSLIFC